jgi:4-amino-4-deoxy-L-arabinose transferase-like glycosyltransferase
MKDKLFLLLLGMVFVLGFFLRIYQLGDVPRGLYQDETSIGYSAYSIIETGKDEYGKQYPLYFKSFGDQKLPVYIYSTVLSVLAFGPTAFAVRFPSALFGFLTLIVFYFYIKDVSRDRVIALIAALLLAINPWHLFYNRATFEVSMSLFFFLFGGYLLHMAFTKKHPWLFLPGTLCFIVSLYSYNLTRLLAPALFVLYLVWYRKSLKIVDRNVLITTGIIGLASLIPFLMTFFQSGGVASAKGTLIFSSAAVQAPLLELRTFVIDTPLFAKLFFNSLFLTVFEYIKHITAYFSVIFYFLAGEEHGNHGIGNVGQLYLFEFPLVLLGIFAIIRRKMSYVSLFLVWGLLTILVASLTREAPQATRSFFLIVPLTLLSATGLLEGWRLLQLYKSKFVRFTILGVFAAFVLYNLVYYFVSYYVMFPVLYAADWREQDKPLAMYLQEHEKQYDQIIIDRDAGFIYSSLLYHTLYPPSNFQREVRRGPDDTEGFSPVNSFGKYHYRSLKEAFDTGGLRTLVITNGKTVPQGMRKIKTFSFPTRNVFFPVGQDIRNAVVTDTAYEVYSTE